MRKKTSQREGLGGSVLVDRRGFVGKMGLAAAGVTAASLVPLRSSLASIGAKVGSTRTTAASAPGTGGLPSDFLSYADPIPHVYPRITGERAVDPMDHIALA